MDASDIYPRRLNAKAVLISQKDGEFVFLVADGSAKLPGRAYEFQEPTLRRESTVRRENLSGESRGDREEFQPQETKDDEGINEGFFGLLQKHGKNFIYRHHIEPRSSTHVPREESFPIPLKYIDVIRSTHTDLDVAQEKRIDDHWNVDGNRNRSDSWDWFHKNHIIERNSERTNVVREETDKNPNDITPRSFVA